MNDSLRIGRIDFGPAAARSMSELRRLTIQAPVESAHAIKRLRDDNIRLRAALTDALAFIDPEAAADYHLWAKLLAQPGDEHTPT